MYTNYECRPTKSLQNVSLCTFVFVCERFGVALQFSTNEEMEIIISRMMVICRNTFELRFISI